MLCLCVSFIYRLQKGDFQPIDYVRNFFMAQTLLDDPCKFTYEELRMKKLWLILATAFLVLPGWASATLIGDDVLIEQYTTSTGTLRDDWVTVSNGVELSCPGAFDLCTANIPGGSEGSIDIGASSILFNLGTIIGASFLSDIFNGYIFSSLDWTDGPGFISGVSLSTDIDGLDLSRIGFGSDYVAVNFESLLLDSDDTYFELFLDVTHAIPEPGSLGLLALSLVGFLAGRRSKR